MTNAGERQLGHYMIIRQLGAGGMGEVYLADDKRLARKVAVKVLPADLTRNDEAKRRLRVLAGPYLRMGCPASNYSKL